MKIRNLSSIAAVALVMMAHTSASAAWYTGDIDTKITNIGLNVYDLRPDDGIAAAYWMESSSAVLSTSYVDRDAGTSGSISRTFDVAGAVDLHTRGSSVQSAWLGSSGTLSTSVFIADSKGYFDATATQTMRVSIAPHTAFVVSGLVLYTADYRNVDPYVKNVDSQMTVSVSANDGTTNEREFRAGYAVNDYSQPFALSYANMSDDVQHIDVSYQIATSAHIYPAVPEPSTWMMLGGGVAALALRMRRASTTAAIA